MTIEIAETGATAIDSDRWPDVARVPRSRLSAVIADRLIRRAAARLPVRLVYPDGTVVGAADATLPTMVIHRPDAFACRLGRYGLIGFGESYMAGEWDSDDPVGVLNEFAKSVDDLIPPALQRLRPLAVVRSPCSQHNSRAQARRNIAEHYDLSNDLFAEFLDETMTYSSALFDALPASQSDLPSAQRRKIDRLLDTARVGPGSRVLEIGTGWGELCLVHARAAARAWTRHPNYFGDTCVWWGLWLAGIAAWVSLLTVLSRVLMTYFLVYATGAKLTEKYMRHRPGFAEYRSRTSFFVPTLPKSQLP